MLQKTGTSFFITGSRFLFSLSIYHSHHKSRGIGLQSAANYRDQDIIRQVPLLQLLKDALEPYRGLPPETYIIGLGTQPVTAPWYHRHWAEFWRIQSRAPTPACEMVSSTPTIKPTG